MKTIPHPTLAPPPDVSRVLVSPEQIKDRVDELARQISRDYAGANSLLLVGILLGAFIFMADLTRRLTVPHTVDFMALSSYGRNTSSGEVRVLLDLREPVKGRDVLIVEDIIDSGRTLDYLYRLLQARQPASLQTCVMVRKRRPNLNPPVRYQGFELPDVWVVGYGLDHADRYRTLPYIAELVNTAGKEVGPMPWRPFHDARRLSPWAATDRGQASQRCPRGIGESSRAGIPSLQTGVA